MKPSKTQLRALERASQASPETLANAYWARFEKRTFVFIASDADPELGFEMYEYDAGKKTAALKDRHFTISIVSWMDYADRLELIRRAVAP